MCVCVGGWVGGWVCVRACVRECVCVCVREREGEKERGRGGREHACVSTLSLCLSYLLSHNINFLN